MKIQNKSRKAYMAFIYALLYIPILIIIIYSFSKSKIMGSWGGFTLKWYVSLLADFGLLKTALNSVILGCSAATLASVVGVFGAVGLYRYRFKAKNFYYILLYIVMMSPEVVMGISLMALFLLIKIPLGFFALLITHTTFSLPFVIITLFTRLADFDESIVEVSKDLGANEFATFKYIIIPMLMPAILSGWLLSFTLSFDDVIGSSFVASSQFKTLPLEIYSMVRLGVKPEVNALSTVIFLISLTLVIVSQVILHKGKTKKKKYQ